MVNNLEAEVRSKENTSPSSESNGTKVRKESPGRKLQRNYGP
jgi:hypothetical protein